MTRLRSLLLRWLLVPTLALWAASIAFGYWRSLAQAHEAHDRALLGSARVVSENLSVEDGDIDVQLPPAALEMLRTDAQDRIYYRVAELDGPHITGYADLPAPPQAPGAEPLLYDATYKEQAVRIAALRIVVFDGAAHRRVLVQVAETLDARHQLTRRIVVEAAAVQLLLIALAAVLIVVGVRRGLAPLKRLRDDVRARRPDDLTPVATDEVPREVVPLIDAINEQTERQRELAEAQVRFVANASHQLKTPLTVLRAQATHALMQTEPEAMRDIVTRLLHTTEATGRMVEQLLAMARSEPGRSLDARDLDLTELARQATFDQLALARDKRIDLGFEGDGAVPVRGEPVLLRELVVNLVHNAIVYTGERGQVTVSVGLCDGRPELAVVDNGPGIAPAERERVLERFYRPPGTPSAGSGLGLAIVKEICARHGVALSLGDVPEGGPGLCVRLLWPPAGGPAA